MKILNIIHFIITIISLIYSVLPLAFICLIFFTGNILVLFDNNFWESVYLILLLYFAGGLIGAVGLIFSLFNKNSKLVLFALIWGLFSYSLIVIQEIQTVGGWFNFKLVYCSPIASVILYIIIFYLKTRNNRTIQNLR